jgi:hypothetical protein
LKECLRSIPALAAKTETDITPVKDESIAEAIRAITVSEKRRRKEKKRKAEGPFFFCDGSCFHLKVHFRRILHHLFRFNATLQLQNV